jgi:chromate transport protein ChrA
MPTLAPALRPFRRSHRAASTPTTSSRTPGRSAAAVGVPAFLALCYCLYTAFIAGDNGWSTGLTWLIALVSAAVVGVLCYAIGRWQPGRQPETIGTVYAVVFGIAMGYLLSLSNWSILKASLVGFALAASMGVCAFYIVHTHRHHPFRRPRTRSGR